MHIVVFGAGAVGSVLGGLLADRNHDVCLVGRPSHVRSIIDEGLRLRSSTGDYVVHPEATDSLSSVEFGGETCVFLTVKSQHTQRCVEELAAAAPASTPVVSFQNGVANEAVISEAFPTVYAGVCRMTCSMIQPGHASFRRMGRVIVGRHPKGTDALAKGLGAAFDEAGLDVCVSRNVGGDRWLKLAVNTQSVFHALVDDRDHEANEFYEIKASILEETQRVFKAAKIRPKSYDGRDPSIDEMVAELRRPRARRVNHGMKVHNSTWQDLYLKRESIEAPFFHQPVIDLGKQHGVAVPFNRTALDLARDCHGNATGPGTLRLTEVLKAVEERS